MITTSAPGKLMLMGEYAVLYGYPCIVTAVDQRMRATVTLIEEPVLKLGAADVKLSGYEKSMGELGKGDVPKAARFVEMTVRNFLMKHPIKRGVHVITSSDFASTFGFGSSSASTVCVAKALFELHGIAYKPMDVFELAYKTVLDVQGKGSGFDVAAATFGGTLYYMKDRPEKTRVFDVSLLPLVVGYSGIKADTVTLIDSVAKRVEEKKLDHLYADIGTLLGSASLSLDSKNIEKFGALMNMNQKHLVTLGASIPKLDAMIDAALHAGAYGAKLSGAGGGDCMIALVPEERRADVEKAIEGVGGEVLRVQCNAKGVCVENPTFAPGATAGRQE